MLVRLLIISNVIVAISAQEVEILSNILESANTPIKVIEADLLLMQDKWQLQDEKVKIQLYYECLCPDCLQFDTTSFIQVYKQLKDYLDVHTYPYGNAKTIVNNDGTVEFECQHGEAECYGNMLHACAIDILSNVTASIEFNTCMMDSGDRRGSDDFAADRCGHQLGVNAATIKECAKGQKGKDLLKHFGDESHKVTYNYVPFVLINGAEWNQDKDTDFRKRVCQEFSEPPPACKDSV